MNYTELSSAIQTYTENNFPTITTASSYTAGSFTVGSSYTITSVGTTSFTSIGASANTVGVVFTATGVGSGTGTALLTSTSTEQINRFIQQAEQRVYNLVQLANLRRNVTSTLSPSTKYLSPPSDFLSMHSFAVYTTGGDYLYLLDKDVNFIREAYPNPSDTGKPKYYAIFGAQYGRPEGLSLLLGPTPDVAYNVELHYYYYPESIVTAGNTWLSDHFDIALLYGSLVEAYTFMKGEQDMIALYDGKFKEAIGMLRNLGNGEQRTDSYRTGQPRQVVT